MTAAQIKQEIAYWRKEAAELTAAMNAKMRGALSATISSSGGSQSYSNYSISDFKAAIREAKNQIRLWKAKLDRVNPSMPVSVSVIYKG